MATLLGSNYNSAALSFSTFIWSKAGVGIHVCKKDRELSANSSEFKGLFFSENQMRFLQTGSENHRKKGKQFFSGMLKKISRPQSFF